MLIQPVTNLSLDLATCTVRVASQLAAIQATIQATGLIVELAVMSMAMFTSSSKGDLPI